MPSLTFLATVFALAARVASADDAADDFSPISNPTGNWSYGTTSSVGAPFSLFTSLFTSSEGIDVWFTGNFDGPSVFHNPTDSIIHNAGTTSVLPGMLAQHPGIGGQCSVVRWTAPIAGTVQVVAQFTGISGFGGAPLTTTDVHVLQNDVAFFDAVLNIGGSPNEAGVVMQRTVAVADRIDFVIGFGNGSFLFDSTGMEATVTYQTAPVEAESWGSTKARYRE